MQASGNKPIWCSPSRDDDNQSQEHVHTLLSLHTPPMMRSPQEKEAARHFDMHNSVISLLSSSPESSSGSDTSSTGTDRSNGPHYLANIEHPISAHDAHLVVQPPYSNMEYLDNQERYVQEGKISIPLNTMTQEKVHRKRPAPSPVQIRFNPKQPASDSCLSTLTGGKSSMLAKLASNLLQQLENEATGTLLVYQPTCLDHHNDSHQESRQRLCVLGGPEGVLHKDRFKDLKWANLNELRPARLNDILRVHTIEYIQHLERACGNLPEQSKKYLVGTLFDKEKGDKELTYDAWLQTKHALKCFGVGDQPSGGSFDMDSPISKSSYMAARMAAGAVCHAIDKVLSNETKNAFVVVRPPGHHAGPNGCVEGEGFHLRPEMCTCGFCLINNVCIGASYAMSNYYTPYYTHPAVSNMASETLVATRKRVNVQRVAIVDFDIHHGNGTEEVIRNLIPHKQNYPLPPSWAPVQFSSYKPWRDERDPENVFFSSIHLYDDDNFYPCSGVGPHGCSPELEKSKNVVNLPLKVLGPKYLDERLKLSSKAKRSLMEISSKAFRDTVTKKLVPALTKFQPDLIMLSAGFDGHADDFYYFLSEDDYGWITEQITAVAEDCCDGRIISVLEGGYNVVPSKCQRPQPKARKSAISNFHYAAKMHNRPVDEELNAYGSLARSVASHVAALMRASQI
ncbi:histone deacetylase, putative [Phytophthora infestans T30-4]|uniref:Histone deacetylase, putative n=1 Tax=Phytophthora infestans (strain T30-4) TaxID=403677 RepID=D0N3Q6_PHYIT|nr:histone deacetylase, putative [Phytophthora infestans T30-4]EEY69010.1 histone deacetylase, putative [Phytophthora infestans T30-4]|eukprot:XP_002998864.1 histone deacetylase, putative [Phytophthora infestans T30-4]